MIVNAGNNFDTASGDLHIALPYIIKALELCGTEVIAPGVQELSCDAKQLSKTMQPSSIRMVSANVPGFMPYAVLSKNHGKTRVLVTSVIDPDLLPASVKKSKHIGDPVAALHRVQQQVPHDLFVVVIHAEPEKIDSYIGTCPGIDLVIDGLSAENRDEDKLIGKPPVVSNNEKGMFVAYTDYSGKIAAGSHFINPVRLRASVDHVAGDPVIAELVKEYEQKSRVWQNSRAQMHSEMRREPSPYAGSSSCNLCHAEINDIWAGSRHAAAMDTLARNSREYDQDCLSCHVTGLEDKPSAAGFSKITESHPMAGVQCEACHGPGVAHIKNPKEVEMQPVTEMTCTRCHTNYTDPEFDYCRDLSIVSHEKVKIGASELLSRCRNSKL